MQMAHMGQRTRERGEPEAKDSKAFLVRNKIMVQLSSWEESGDDAAARTGNVRKSKTIETQLGKKRWRGYLNWQGGKKKVTLGRGRNKKKKKKKKTNPTLPHRTTTRKGGVEKPFRTPSGKIWRRGPKEDPE